MITALTLGLYGNAIYSNTNHNLETCSTAKIEDQIHEKFMSKIPALIAAKNIDQIMSLISTIKRELISIVNQYPNGNEELTQDIMLELKTSLESLNVESTLHAINSLRNILNVIPKETKDAIKNALGKNKDFKTYAIFL